jgi:hypothetical protein
MQERWSSQGVRAAGNLRRYIGDSHARGKLVVVRGGERVDSTSSLRLFIIIALVIMWLQSKPKEHASAELPEDELRCMVEMIYHEGRGESI